jgi:hypothetical protein
VVITLFETVSSPDFYPIANGRRCTCSSNLHACMGACLRGGCQPAPTDHPASHHPAGAFRPAALQQALAALAAALGYSDIFAATNASAL